MSHADTRSVEQIRRDAERARANLTEAVDQLRGGITDAASDVRERFSPQGIKAGVNDYVSERAEDLADAARRNPLQAAAVGALVAWPALKVVRAIPLPILMIGAGLFLTGSRTGKDVSRKALDQASALADEARRKAQDLGQTVSEAASDAAASARQAAHGVVDRTTEAVADVAERARAAMPDVSALGATADSASVNVKDNAHDAAAVARATMNDARRKSRSLADDALEFAQANPLLVAGLGLLAGGFVAGSLPPTQTERSVAGAVSGAMREAARQGATAAVGVAAGAAIDLARVAIAGDASPQRSQQGQDHNIAGERA